MLLNRHDFVLPRIPEQMVSVPGEGLDAVA
jgi:hypothetical protein